MVAFGLQVLLGAHFIRCADATGSIHLEWGGCAPGTEGHCSRSCDDNAPGDDRHPPVPCDDTPVFKGVTVATSRSFTLTPAADAPMPVWAVPSETLQQPGFAFAPLRVERRSAAPPPAMASIRTIVLVV